MCRSVNRGIVSRTICCWILLFVAFFVAQECFAAGDLALFGPKRYERAQGKPWVFTDTFNGCATTASQALLRVRNGSSKESSLSSALITLNGTNVLAESDFKNQTLLLERTVTVRPGQNILAVQLKSGGQKETPFLVVEILGQGCSSGDSTPPVVTNPQPADGALLTIPVPVISASYADNAGGTGIDPAAVRVLLDGVDLTPACTVNDTGVSCTPSRGLAEGGHTVTVSVADLAQNPAALTWGFATDTVAPHLTITSPANGQFLGNSTITVGGSIDDATAAVTVNGLAATVGGGVFSAAGVPLKEGLNTLTAAAYDRAGNHSAVSVEVTLDTALPVVTVTAPAAGSFTAQPLVTVTGAVSEPPVSVTVNGRSASVSDTSFTLADLPLAEGNNIVTVDAVDRSGNKGSTSVTITLDTVPPQLFVSAPADGILTRSPALTVTGTVSEPLTALTVNGTELVVSDTAFSHPLVLVEGVNVITLEATDRAGNRGKASVTVTLDSTPPTAPTLEGPVSPTNRPLVTLNGSAEPWSNVALYRGTERIATIVTPQDGRFSFPDTPLAEGENSFSATALDPAGNESSPSVPLILVLDTRVPAITVTAPAEPKPQPQVEAKVPTAVPTPPLPVAGARPGTIQKRGKDEAEMVYIPAGTHHCPMNILRADRPIFHFTTGPGGAYIRIAPPEK